MDMSKIDKSKYTPMMQQYLEIKKDYADAIVFFRLGDFYEMFFEDAFLASKVLEIALTGRDAGQEERVPMCGIPFHAYAAYAEKLIKAGYKVAIVEQVEDVSEAKGIVKRDVVKILTPGTIVEAFLNEKENNYIVSIDNNKNKFIISYLDVSTGDSYLTTFMSEETLIQELLNLKCREVVVKPTFNKNIIKSLQNKYQILVSIEEKTELTENFISLASEIDDEYLSCLAILFNYTEKTQKHELIHLKKVVYYNASDYLKIDSFTKRNLELNETLRQGNKNGSLLWYLDKCQTAMGSRMLNKWIDKPLISLVEINNRLDFVDVLNNSYLVRQEIKEALKTVYDLERILGRISLSNANAKDLVQLRKTLSNVPNIKAQIANLKLNQALELSDAINPHNELYELLLNSLVENPPLVIKEGQMIKEGFNKELDDVKNISQNSKDWIINYELSERERTGIKTLKVGYNRVFGYYIEITKGQISLIKDEFGYDRKQTIANAERFITPELKKYEQIVINAKDKIEKLEYELFIEIRNEVSKYVKSLQILANHLSVVDCYIAFSEVSVNNHFIRPIFNQKNEVNIIDGRHPVIEDILKEKFVVNDVVINKYNMMLITGPNMSGKSTYMRMLAIIIVMAQIGCFVPAKIANLVIFDQIFTRIGASDDLISGQSTFMVEMMEANYALLNATKNSLILFDEIGRGTATFDGMALAQAILEYVHERIGCITLFSTHYHELVGLEQTLKHLKNVHVAAVETKNGVQFLHKVLDGPTDKSYGINVASLAGLPKSVIERSKQILNVLEEENKNAKNIKLDLFNFEAYENKEENIEAKLLAELKEDIKRIDMNSISPIDAFKILIELQEKIK